MEKQILLLSAFLFSAVFGWLSAQRPDSLFYAFFPQEDYQAAVLTVFMEQSPVGISISQPSDGVW